MEGLRVGKGRVLVKLAVTLLVFDPNKIQASLPLAVAQNVFNTVLLVYLFVGDE